MLGKRGVIEDKNEYCPLHVDVKVENKRRIQFYEDSKLCHYKYFKKEEEPSQCSLTAQEKLARKLELIPAFTPFQYNRFGVTEEKKKTVVKSILKKPKEEKLTEDIQKSLEDTKTNVMGLNSETLKKLLSTEIDQTDKGIFPYYSYC